MLKRVSREEASHLPLPGRDWYSCVGPSNSDARNLSVGLSVYPAGSAPAGHIHPNEEEVVHVIAGMGKLITSEGTVSLEPGTTVYIPPGLHHATVADGTEPLQLLCSFSPPVVPGSYESGSR